MFLNIFLFMGLAFGLDPQSYPIFLKYGYSSVIEFEEAPIKAVLGDSQSFQVEKVEKSIVVRPLVNNASSNMFVYFKTYSPRLIILTANDEVTPTLFKKFESMILKPTSVAQKIIKTEVRPKANGITIFSFDRKKDFLNIDFVLVADSKNKIEPKWEQVYLKAGKLKIKADKVWSERREVQKDTYVKARATFVRPNISSSSDVLNLIIPTNGAELIFLVKKGSLK